MIITLPEDLERLLEAEVAGGYVKSVQAAVETAVRAHFTTIADLRRSLDDAEADYRANGGVSWDDVKARLDRRLADAD